MDADEMARLWHYNKDRPTFVRNHRETINELCNTEEPVPDGSVYEVQQWINDYMGVVTRQLPNFNETAYQNRQKDAEQEAE